MRTIVDFLKFVARLLLVLGLLIVTFVVAALAFLVLTHQISIQSAMLVRAKKFLPATVEISWRDAGIDIMSLSASTLAPVPPIENQKPRSDERTFPGTRFLKHVVFHADRLCVRYARTAVNSCFDHVQLGLTGGWGEEATPHAKWTWMPGLRSIDPIVLLGGMAHFDLKAFPPSDPNAPPSKISVLDLLRNDLLPKWNLSGSEVDLNDLELKSSDDIYHARFQMSTRESGDALRVVLDQFNSRSGLVSAGGLIQLKHDGGLARRHGAWKVVADAHAKIQRKMLFNFKADANVENWHSVDFRLMTQAHGVAALREARVEAKYRDSKLDGIFSMKLGQSGSQVKAMDFVNCLVDANLEQKSGAVRCGPQAVRLKIREIQDIAQPELFVLQPAFDLKISKLNFGDVKSGDVSLALTLDHLGLLSLRSKFEGHFEKKPSLPLQYKLSGHAQLLNENFAKVVKVLLSTPFSVPAPFNDLKGKIALNAIVNLEADGGSVDYELRPDLDSNNQAVHLRLTGETDYLTHRTDPNGKLELATDISLLVDALRISAPRFDLAVPPQVMPDRRFHPIQVAAPQEKVNNPMLSENPPPAVVAAQVKVVARSSTSPSTPMRFRLRVKTSQNRAIQIATSLTKTVIPIDTDIIFSTGIWGTLSSPPPELANFESRRILLPNSPSVAANQNSRLLKVSKTTGFVWFGETKLDLFRRNATLDHLRVDFLADGGERLEGRAGVHYLQYDIAVLINGEPAHPSISFMSRPELENQQQIIAVLLFGRPMTELSQNDKSSVSNLQAAFADAALGAGSLYLLANTPVESIGYDPTTQSLRATVGLGGGASIDVGTTDSVGFNKTLSREFTFRTEVDKLASSGANTVSAMIEWVKGF